MKRGSNWVSGLRTMGPLSGLVVVFGLFAFLRPETFLTWNNVEIMLLQTAVVGTAALGMTLVIISGGIDLSVGSAIALCTVAVALVLKAGGAPIVAALAGIGTGALCGCVSGTLITRLRLTPFIVTLGMWGALRGLAKGLANEQVVMAPETWLNGLLTSLNAGNRWMLLPPGVWILLVLAGITYGVLHHTRFGIHTHAVGSNERTARLCGVRVGWTRFCVYVVAGAFAGMAGVLQFSYLTMGDPTTSMGAELDVIAAVVIGGASLTGGEGSVLGSLLGALIMTVVGNGCTKLGMDNWVQEIVTGGIIILAVVLDRLRHREE